METNTVKALIEAGMPVAEVVVQGDGSHFEARVVSDAFSGQSAVKRQQLVFGTLGDRITTGEIHALTIKAYTPDEWEKARKLQVSS